MALGSGGGGPVTLGGLLGGCRCPSPVVGVSVCTLPREGEGLGEGRGGAVALAPPTQHQEAFSEFLCNESTLVPLTARQVS